MFSNQNSTFEIIVISHPTYIKNEIEALERLCKEGLSYFHLRKKTWFKEDLEQWIQQLDEGCYKNVVLHNHPQLVFDYNLKGFHFNSSHPYQEKLARQLQETGKTISIAAHSICDMGEYELEVDYQLVSPVFPSISKPDLIETLDHKKLKDYLLLKPKSKFMALGGIDGDNIQQAKALGFDGAASLGYLWKDFEKNGAVNELLQRYHQLKKHNKEFN